MGKFILIPLTGDQLGISVHGASGMDSTNWYDTVEERTSLLYATPLQGLVHLSAEKRRISSPTSAKVRTPTSLNMKENKYGMHSKTSVHKHVPRQPLQQIITNVLCNI